MSTYLSKLKQRLENEPGYEEPLNKNISTETLEERIQKWYSSLSSPVKQQRYYIDDLGKIFNVSPKKLGDALRRLGWTRKREWTTASNRRYWLGPQ